jgi:hypothetical protein
VDSSKPLVILKVFGEVLDFLKNAEGFLVSTPEPQHLRLCESNIDSLPVTLLGPGKTIETIVDRRAVARCLGRGEPSRGAPRRPQQVFKCLLVIPSLLVVMTEDFRLLIK